MIFSWQVSHLSTALFDHSFVSAFSSLEPCEICSLETWKHNETYELIYSKGQNLLSPGVAINGDFIRKGVGWELRTDDGVGSKSARFWIRFETRFVFAKQLLKDQ